MNWIGIDPGKSGALAEIDEQGNILYLKPMPLIGKEIDLQALFDFFESRAGTVILEKVGSNPGMGHSSAFTFGKFFGYLEGLVAGLKMKYILVHPRTWQKEMWEKKADNPKASSLLAARQLFPNEKFLPTLRSSKPHDGMVDALLLAEYGRRKNI